MQRTHEEIVARIHAVEKDDWMGTQTSDLLVRLPFELAKPFLKPEATSEGWTIDEQDPMQRAKDYLEFAWGKANDCRGLSASRSIDHFRAWLWLAGKDKQLAELSGYERYGKPQLVMVSAMCDFDWRAHDSGDWVNGEDGPSLSKAEIEELAKRHEALSA